MGHAVEPLLHVMTEISMTNTYTLKPPLVLTQTAQYQNRRAYHPRRGAVVDFRFLMQHRFERSAARGLHLIHAQKPPLRCAQLNRPFLPAFHVGTPSCERFVGASHSRQSPAKHRVVDRGSAYPFSGVLGRGPFADGKLIPHAVAIKPQCDILVRDERVRESGVQLADQCRLPPWLLLPVSDAVDSPSEGSPCPYAEHGATPTPNPGGPAAVAAVPSRTIRAAEPRRR